MKFLSFLFKQELKLAQFHADRMKMKQELASIRHANDPEKKKIANSKIVLWFVLGDFLCVQLFCMWFMKTYPEYGDLGAFIALAILGQVGTILGYYKKSSTENTVGGIVYDSAMIQLNSSDDAVG